MRHRHMALFTQEASKHVTSKGSIALRAGRANARRCFGRYEYGEIMKSLIFMIILLPVFSLASEIKKHSVVPENGYIPDQETAIKIAVAIWSPIYGEEHIVGKSPYNAELIDGVWHVSGSLPVGYKGGVPVIEIDKKTGSILRVSHGK